MKKKINARKRIEGFGIICLLFLFLTGCREENMPEGRTLALQKDGSITQTIVDDFSMDYYDFDELSQMNREEVEEYNSSVNREAVTIDDMKTDGSKITVIMQYANTDDYIAMTENALFFGTVEQAQKVGYDMNVSLTSIDKAKTLTKEELLTMGKAHIAIVTEPTNVKTFGNILYISDGVTVEQNKKLATVSGENTAYIVFK
ncbi:MAG: hypothetical protein PUB13_07725 [Lachnospiraceae bacterium]|nr:hypothetical protein [Lachnospiraceae bacterium]